MSRLEEVRDFVRSVDPDLQRFFPFAVEDVRDSGAGAGVYTIKGHAAVFDKWSLDLGGFRERVARGAFDNALSHDPHVLHLWDHDTARALSSTRSKDFPLELRTDPSGLRFYSKVAPTAYAADLRTLLEGGVIDQSSFAFTVAKDEWVITDEGDEERIERTIIEVDQLFDVTTCAMGAYPTTDSALAVRSLSLGRRSATERKERVPVEVRADMESVVCLTQMYQLGQEFMADEDQPGDASDRAAMQQILDVLEGLVEAEASEPNDEGSEMEENSLAHKAGASVRRVEQSAGTAKAEIIRLRREAEAAALVARERLYRRVS